MTSTTRRASRRPTRRRPRWSAVGASAALLVVLLLAGSGGAAAQVSDDPAAPGVATGELVIAVREIRPFAYPTSEGWSGYSIDYWEQVADRLGIDYRYEQVPTVQDQLDAVTSGRAGAALGAISITSERSQVVDFTQPMFDSGLQIMTRPAETTGGLGAVLREFLTPRLLLVLGGLILLLVVMGHVIWLFERRRNPEFQLSYPAGVWEGIWWAMVTMATVGYGDTVARTRAGRIISMVWILTGLVLVAQFTAYVTSNLTVERIRNDIQAIGDLYGRPVATVENTAAARYLEDIDLRATGLPDVDDAAEALLDGRVDAVVYDSPVLRYYARTTGRGRVEVVGPRYQPQGYGMAFTQGSPLLEPVSAEILALQEDGTAENLENRYFGQE